MGANATECEKAKWPVGVKEWLTLPNVIAAIGVVITVTLAWSDLGNKINATDARLQTLEKIVLSQQEATGDISVLKYAIEQISKQLDEIKRQVARNDRAALP